MNARLSFACLILGATVLAQQSQPKADRDKAGLRGPVKAVTETVSYPDERQQTTTTTKYAPDGRILEVREGAPNDSKYITSYTYASDGRLLGTTAGSFQMEYVYDDANRLIEVKSGDKIKFRYQYDEKGRKTEIKPLPFNYSKPPDSAYLASWEDTDLGFMCRSSCAYETSYNELGIASGAKFYDSEGKLVGHVVRTFDSEGCIISDQQIADSPRFDMLPEKARSSFNPEQLKGMAALVAVHQNRAISYSYDGVGRVTEKRRTNGTRVSVTSTKYNEQGDKTSEKETTVAGPEDGQQYRLTEDGAVIPAGYTQSAGQFPPEVIETQYSYQYDSYGNWTEQKASYRSTSLDDQFRPGIVIHRTLTYY